MGGANGKKAVIEIRATADIEALSKCDFALRVIHYVNNCSFICNIFCKLSNLVRKEGRKCFS